MISSLHIFTIKQFKQWCVERDYEPLKIKDTWYARAADGSIQYEFDRIMQSAYRVTPKQYG